MQSDDKVHPEIEAEKITSSYCRQCAGSRNHLVIASASEIDDSAGPTFKTTFDLLRCRGCDALSVRREHYCSDPALVYPEEGWGKGRDDSRGRTEYDCWPGVVSRKLPEWLWEIKNKTMADTLAQTYRAFNDEMPILAAAGTRIIFDLLAEQLLQRDAGTFKEKLEALFTEGHISERQKEILQAVVDAGSAAQHRAYEVPHFDLILILAVLESLIHQTILAGEKVADMRRRTPARKKPVKKV
jgi:Domain of unknown function (DUF4145)